MSRHRLIEGAWLTSPRTAASAGVWAFVMVQSWSRAIYVEFVQRAVVTFMRCHVNAFEYFGGVPRRCLYDNAKMLLEEEWAHMLDLPGRSSLTPYLREERRVGRDGYVQCIGTVCGIEVPWSWAGRTVQLGSGMMEIWPRADRLAVHPRTHRPGQRS